MITKQQKYIHEHDLHEDDYDQMFNEPDENDKQLEGSDEEPEKPHDHKQSHSQKPKMVKKPLQQKNTSQAKRLNPYLQQNPFKK